MENNQDSILKTIADIRNHKKKGVMGRGPGAPGQMKFPTFKEAFAPGSQGDPVQTSSIGDGGTVTESITKFKSFLESLKDTENSNIVEVIEQGFDTCMESKSIIEKKA